MFNQFRTIKYTLYIPINWWTLLIVKLVAALSDRTMSLKEVKTKLFYYYFRCLSALPSNRQERIWMLQCTEGKEEKRQKSHRWRGKHDLSLGHESARGQQCNLLFFLHFTFMFSVPSSPSCCYSFQPELSPAETPCTYRSSGVSGFKVVHIVWAMFKHQRNSVFFFVLF